MRFGRILKNHKILENEIENIIQYAQEIIADVPYKAPVPTQEKYILLEALILKICSLWQRFVEKEIIYAVWLNARKFLTLMDLKENTRLNQDLVRVMIFSDMYRNFQDLEYCVNFSKKYIEDKYNPFLKITQPQKKHIIFTFKIRNYLSHYSGYSKRVLLSDYMKIYNYKNFLEPGKFLLKNKGKKFEDLGKSFQMASIYMKTIFK